MLGMQAEMRSRPNGRRVGLLTCATGRRQIPARHLADFTFLAAAILTGACIAKSLMLSIMHIRGFVQIVESPKSYNEEVQSLLSQAARAFCALKPELVLSKLISAVL